MVVANAFDQKFNIPKFIVLGVNIILVGLLFITKDLTIYNYTLYQKVSSGAIQHSV